MIVISKVYDTKIHMEEGERANTKLVWELRLVRALTKKVVREHSATPFLARIPVNLGL